MNFDTAEKLLDEVRRRHPDTGLDILLEIDVGNIDVCGCSTSDQGDEGKEKESIVQKQVMFLTNFDDNSSTSNNECYPEGESNASLVNSVPCHV